MEGSYYQQVVNFCFVLQLTAYLAPSTLWPVPPPLSAGTVEQAKECFKTCTVTLHIIVAWMLFNPLFSYFNEN